MFENLYQDLSNDRSVSTAKAIASAATLALPEFFVQFFSADKSQRMSLFATYDSRF